MNIEKINIQEKFEKISKFWDPKIIAQLNGQDVKIARVNGSFPKHQHDNEDELFLIIKGTFYLELDDGMLELKAGEMVVIPKGAQHRPFTKSEAHILMFEPSSTINTGNLKTILLKQIWKKSNISKNH